MSWELRVPFRDRSEPLDVDAFADLPGYLDSADRGVVRHVLIGARLRGARTVGDLLDDLAGASPERRRELLDEARVEAGLPTTEEVDAEERFRRANDAASLLAGKESPWQLCHAAGCDQVPLGEVGMPTATDVKRWWCPEHRRLAAEGDMEPRPSRLRFSPGGAIVEVDPEEEARQAAEAERRERQHEEKLAARRVEAAEHEEHERLREEAFRADLGPGVPG
jgi:hypothetical protein